MACLRLLNTKKHKTDVSFVHTCVNFDNQVDCTIRGFRKFVINKSYVQLNLYIYIITKACGLSPCKYY